MKYLLTPLLILSMATCAMSQELSNLVVKGDKFLDKFQYEDALYFYESAYNEDPGNAAITRRIASTYRKLGDLQLSKEWYAKTLNLDESNPEDMLYYAEALKSMKSYDKAILWYSRYAQEMPNDSRAVSHLRDRRYHEDLLADSLKYDIKKLKINSGTPAFGVCSFGDNYLFSSSGINPDFQINYSASDENPFLDIFMCNRGIDGELIVAERLEGTINSKYHDGPVYFDENNMELFITRNNMKNGKPVRDENGNVNLKIFSSQLIGNDWSEVKELSLNSDSYSCGHPWLSNDGEFMVFVSNMEGGFGGTDLYVSERKGESWSAPKNVGEKVNTEGDEMFPQISSDGSLYFASNGHAGLGGMDIFRSNPEGDSWGDPVNLGYPINSNHDDFSFLADDNHLSGYFASNRGGKGSDDIYFFSTIDLMSQFVTGQISSDDPDASLAGEEIEVRSNMKDDSQYFTLDDNESFMIPVMAGEKISVYMADDKYNRDEEVFAFEADEKIYDPLQNVGMATAVVAEEPELADNNEEEIRNELLEMKDSLGEMETEEVEMAAVENDDKSQIAATSIALQEKLQSIHFMFNKSVIGLSAGETLNEIAELMNRNPEIKLEIDTHCDSRGPNNYNDNLSHDRAMNVRKYLTWKGVDKDRLVLKWHGEDQLLNSCSDNVDCSAEEHYINRRAEFTILQETVAAVETEE